MSASGFTAIIPYFSTTTGHTPTTIALGEISINITDGILFIGTGGNAYASYPLSTSSSSVTITGGTINGTTIGASNPASGKFTTLSATGTVSGAGFTALLAAPGPIGSTTASTGAFTTLSSNLLTATGGTINSTSVGATTPSTGAFTTLSASGTVSGAGFSSYLASPPAIGGTTAAAATFTTCTATTFNSTSTKRLKKNIKRMPEDFAGFVIDQLEPVNFVWKKNTTRSDQRDFGFIAEDVEKLLPEIVSYNDQDQVTGMDYGRLTAILWAEVKGLRLRMASVENGLGR